MFAKHDDDAQFRRQGIDGAPHVRGAFTRGYRIGRRFARRRCQWLRFAQRPPPIGPLAIERCAPGDAHEPGAETVAIAQMSEAPIGTRQRFLRHVFGVLPMVQDAVGDAKRQPRRLDEPGLEFANEIVLHGYEAGRQPIGVLIHGCMGA